MWSSKSNWFSVLYLSASYQYKLTENRKGNPDWTFGDTGSVEHKTKNDGKQNKNKIKQTKQKRRARRTTPKYPCSHRW